MRSKLRVLVKLSETTKCKLSEKSQRSFRFFDASICVRLSTRMPSARLFS